MKKSKNKLKKGSVKRLIGLFLPHKMDCVFMFLMLIISAVFVSVGPRVLGMATDSVVSGLERGGIDWRLFLTWAGLSVGVYLLQFLSKWFAGRISARIVSKIAYNLRGAVEKKLWKLPLNYYDTNQRGDIMSRTTNDIDNIVMTLNQTSGDFFYYLLMLIGMIVMMITLSWQLALVTIILIPLSGVIIKKVTALARPKFAKQWQYMGKINANVEESFNGHNIIKAYKQEERFSEEFRRQNGELYKSAFQATVISNLIQPLSRLLTNLNYVIVALVGAFNIISGAMSIGDVQAFIQYARQFQQPFTQLAQMFSTLQSGMASLERVYEVLDSDEETPEMPGAYDRYELKGQIEFKDVSFSYVPEKKLIEHMNLSVKPGQTIAIVGGTGAGKTTLVNLIERFYEINSGQIILDGNIEIHRLSRAALRRNIGMVLQDTWLYKGTIEENIKYGLPEDREVSDEQFLEACRATFVDSFVRTLPDGYKTVLNNEQTAVSAGEKQLLTIARAFLLKPNILILDEATSSVDTRTEALIQEAINRLREGRTSFVIAHRLSTIRGADIILVMHNGHIVEQGNHEELLALDGEYAKLYKAQFAH
ncbi:MAG TPA: ABC transporter ATP-binding protein [Candidatus Scatovicinus merdipullorum]|nr:ABC transporter ATP-binding protein [Candidatus Scatovicinus merdipullorum]